MAEIMRYQRWWPLEGIEISRAHTDGRTVEAYAAIFDSPYEVRDQHGHYMERITRSAFDKTLRERGTKGVACLYNHGMTVHGTPDMLGSVPLGTPLDIRADGRGLLTVTRYNRSALADATLEAIRSGDIRSQSFRGRIYQSTPNRVPRRRDGDPLSEVVRTELGLSDYGPTPIPVNDGAEIVAVRSIQDLATYVTRLDEGQVEEFLDTLDETVRANLAHFLAPTTPREPEAEPATPSQGAGAEEPLLIRCEHSGRQSDITRRIRVAQILRE